MAADLMFFEVKSFLFSILFIAFQQQELQV